MPYRKQKKYPLYKGISKRVNTYGPATMQLAKDVAYLGSIINSEPTNFEVKTSGNVGYNGVVIDLTAVPQGDSAGTRHGNILLPRFISFRMHANKRISASTADHITFRVMLFRSWVETADTATVPAPADIMNIVGAAGAPMSHLNDNVTGARGDRQRRIEVLRSDFITLDAVGKTSKDYSYNIQMNGPNVQNKQHIKYLGAATATAISGGIYCYLCSDNATATEVAYYIDSRLTFYDN